MLLKLQVPLFPDLYKIFPALNVLVFPFSTFILPPTIQAFSHLLTLMAVPSVPGVTITKLPPLFHVLEATVYQTLRVIYARAMEEVQVPPALSDSDEECFQVCGSS